MIRIYKEMLYDYIHRAVEGVVMSKGYASTILSDYDADIAAARAQASHSGHLELLQAGLQYLLGHPDLDLTTLYQSEYSWDDENLRPVLVYVYQALFPSDPIPQGGRPDVELVRPSTPGWNVSMPGSPDLPRPPTKA